MRNDLPVSADNDESFFTTDCRRQEAAVSEERIFRLEQVRSPACSRPQETDQFTLIVVYREARPARTTPSPPSPYQAGSTGRPTSTRRTTCLWTWSRTTTLIWSKQTPSAGSFYRSTPPPAVARNKVHLLIFTGKSIIIYSSWKAEKGGTVISDSLLIWLLSVDIKQVRDRTGVAQHI